MKLYLINPVNATYNTLRKDKFCVVKELEKNELEDILQGEDLLKGKVLGSSESEEDLCRYPNVRRHIIQMPQSFEHPEFLYTKDYMEIFFTPDHWNSAQEIPVSDFPLYASSMKYISQEFEEILKGNHE